MPPFTRTRTGCSTCKGDGYKCDEQKPECTRCKRLEKSCSYDLKLKWQDPIEPQSLDKSPRASRKRKASSSSPTALVRRQPQRPALSVSPRAMGSGIAPGYGRLLNHWSTHLASMIVMAPTVRNQFHAHITPMIDYSPALRSAICSMAARHLSVLRDDPSWLNIATRLQNDVVPVVRRILDTESSENPLISLAIIMILEITNRQFITDSLVATNSSVDHMMGADIIIRRAGPKIWESEAGAFLQNVCCYYDSTTSVSKGASPILNLGHGILIQEAMKPVERLKALWAIIGRISNMRSREGSLLDEEGINIEHDLRIFDTSSCEGDTFRTVHAYKEAAYIYLHRVWHNVGAPHPLALKHARDCLNHLFRVPVCSSLVTGHAWPLFTAACETIDSTLRNLALERVRAMYEFRRLPALQRLEQDIKTAWEKKDKERTATGIDNIDCVQAIIAIRQRGPDLA
ncbi:fungal-specific transcription factor domain-containing protein [Nemania abortiva]|nr:fungal-specific transcription factor domain-containing protein [Nemania abortiva]